MAHPVLVHNERRVEDLVVAGGHHGDVAEFYFLLAPQQKQAEAVAFRVQVVGEIVSFLRARTRGF